MPHKPRHALYILPNAFTTAALFCGFYAILQSINSNWQMAALMIIAAGVLDACDGRVARLTGTESAFGVEYDSLSDVVAFGVAPAILVYQWALYQFNQIGFGIAFCYCAATALRLARFNTQAGSGDRRFFIGIPSPAAAILIASLVAAGDKHFNHISPYAIAFVCLLMAFTMVSAVRFYSFKTINLRTRRPLYSGLILILVVAAANVLADNITIVLLALLSLYVVISYGYMLWTFLRRYRTK